MGSTCNAPIDVTETELHLFYHHQGALATYKPHLNQVVVRKVVDVEHFQILWQNQEVQCQLVSYCPVHMMYFHLELVIEGHRNDLLRSRV